MTTLREEFEALMPEPTAHRYWSKGHSSRWQLAGRALPPDAEPLYTADQVREAMKAIAERCAVLCEEQAGAASFVNNYSATFGAEQCAAAIRAQAGGDQI